MNVSILKQTHNKWVLIVSAIMILSCVLATGCSRNEASADARILQLEQRVDYLESIIAKSQGTDVNPSSGSTELPQGIISNPASGVTPGAKINTTEATQNYQSYGGRCQATTKRGKQCKRQAEAGFSFCWQHH